MRILHVHNFYQQPGGEDLCFAATGKMLEAAGHDVVRYTVSNHDIEQIGRFGAARNALWNDEARKRLKDLIKRTRPDIAHFENTFPLISPSGYYACRSEGVPVVQTLHNFRTICPAAILYRSGRVCEDCFGRKVPWPGFVHRCYRNSSLGSATVTAMIALHRVLGTWNRLIDAYIALNSFVRSKFIEGGLDPAKIHVNPNFLPDMPSPGSGDGGYALFAGRLTQEKGIDTLIAAWAELAPDLPLKIVGDGPEAAKVAQAVAGQARIEWLGWRPAEDVLELMGGAVCVIAPSTWYETFNRTLMEAFAMGTPVIGSGHGSMQAIIKHQCTGLLFEPGNPTDLVRQVRWLLASPDALQAMRKAARREFEACYTGPINHERLMDIYQTACAAAKERNGHARAL